MNILLIAEPFGFGPVGSLMACRNQIDDPIYTWKYAGPSFSEPIVTKERFDTCLFLNDNFNIQHHALYRLITWADIIISGTEFRIADVIRNPSKKLIIYDPLFWFWPTIPEVSHPNTYFVCPNFTGVQERFSQIPSERKNYFFRIKPPQYKRKTRAIASWYSHVLIHLCGFINPILTLDGYYEIILDCFIDAFRYSRWQKITVTGNSTMIKQMKLNNTRKFFHFRTFNHDEMIQELSTANLFITSPGLNSTLEAMSLQIPIGFLPPQNNSQAYQLEIFEKHGLSPVSMDWNSFGETTFGWKNECPELSIRALRDAMNTCIRSQNCVAQLTKSLTYLLNLSEEGWRKYSERQWQFFVSLISDNLETFSNIFHKIAQQN